MRLLHCPTPIEKGVVDRFFNHFVTFIAGASSSPICDYRTHHAMVADHNRKSLSGAEHAVKLLTTYCWLHYRFDMHFPYLTEALSELEALTKIISGLLRTGAMKKCTSCGRDVPWNHQFGICTPCFQSRRHYRDDYDDDYNDYRY